jgi:hypothetical protein
MKHTEEKPLVEIKRVGFMGKGYLVSSQVWENLETAFKIGPLAGLRDPKNPEAPPNFPTHDSSHRTPTEFLTQHPADLLVVDSVELTDYDVTLRNPLGEPCWLRMIRQATLSETHPKIVIESWDDQTILDAERGPASKKSRVIWKSLGYETRLKRWSADRLDGAIKQARIVVIRVLSDIANKCGPLEWIQESRLPSRPMSNCLRYCGVPRRAFLQDNEKGATAEIACARVDPMPGKVGALINTIKGVRHLLPDEYARGCGVPKLWIGDEQKVNKAAAEGTTCINIFEAVSHSLTKWLAVPSNVPSAIPIINPLNPKRVPSKAPTKKEEPWHWKPPDLALDSDFYNESVRCLEAAVKKLNGPPEMITEGLEALKRHRSNYDAEGARPTLLQILWWRFPETQWEKLRNGGSMNFLHEPAAGIHPNAKMNADEIAVAGRFVDELLLIGAVEKVPPDEPLHCSAPLFTLVKTGQPGEYRVISNMKEGGQNAAVGKDPVFLQRVNHLLSHLYAGGFSAVADASKMFYQFNTRADERKYLGLTHPITLEQHRYKGLPMGGGNSPALANGYGIAFLRLLRAKRPDLFGGEMRPNCWRVALDDEVNGEYNPELGFGMVWTSSDGTPAAQVWGFFDDFLVHGPTYEKCCQGLTAFMDLALEVGFLCHPGKLIPPSHTVLYVGFDIDTTGIPALRIPALKRDKALAMIEYLRDQRTGVSGLGLSVAIGTLESLVEATPNRQGRGHLRQLYDVLGETAPQPARDLDEVLEPPVFDPHQRYYRKVTLTADALQNLLWWETCLENDDACRTAYSPAAHVMTPTWGDGSGTGTGGTIQAVTLKLNEWMGAWLPASLKESSNWKELKTAHLTLHQIESDPTLREKVKGTTVFYFTDNSTTYYICQAGASPSPGLNAIIRKIKILEAKLSIRLEVIHVPGTMMIHQGTDGLSRGIWLSNQHQSQPGPTTVAAVFDPLFVNPALLQWIASKCEQPTVQYCDWAVNWHQIDFHDKFTVWLPPPTIARQLIAYLLNLWAERPLTTSFAIMLPRVMQKDWSSLSRHVQEIGQFKPGTFPTTSRLPIPVVLLYVAPHLRTLPPPYRKPLPLPAAAQWHRQQAEALRGLSAPAHK